MSARRGSSSTIAISLRLSDASATCYHPLYILTHSSSSAFRHATPILFSFHRIGCNTFRCSTLFPCCRYGDVGPIPLWWWCLVSVVSLRLFFARLRAKHNLGKVCRSLDLVNTPSEARILPGPA